jgi:microcystin-dependent protein
MKNIVVVVTSAVILLLTGCASVPMAPTDKDTRAKEFSPAPSKASLYIYRNENFGAAIPMSVAVNGKALGQTAAKTYFHLNVMPGKYNVESHAENVASLPLSMEAGKNYFVWQEVKMGMWMARSLLQQVDENTGRAGVTESKLIASSISDNDVLPIDAPLATASSQAPSSDSASQKLRELQDLRKDGVITEEEFQKKKQQLLEKL